MKEFRQSGIKPLYGQRSVTLRRPSLHLVVAQREASLSGLCTVGMRSNLKAAAGLTLIEMLVVIAVIATLAAAGFICYSVDQPGGYGKASV